MRIFKGRFGANDARWQRRNAERAIRRDKRKNGSKGVLTMGFVKNMVEWVAVPHEPGNEYQMRPVSGTEFDIVDEAGTKIVARAMSALSTVDPAWLRESRDKDADARQSADSTRGLDKTAVLEAGLLDWRGPLYDGVPCDTEHKADLDNASRMWAARWICERSVRAENFDNDSTGNSPTTES